LLIIIELVVVFPRSVTVCRVDVSEITAMPEPVLIEISVPGPKNPNIVADVNTVELLIIIVPPPMFIVFVPVPIITVFVAVTVLNV
jgi:hypothetical protein